MDIEYFTYLEFLKHTKETPRASHDSRTSEKRGGEDFYGTKSLEESYEYAYNGWDAGIKQLELQDGVLVGNGVEFNPNVHGSVVNIPNYLQGLPDSMYEMNEHREYNLEDITIYLQLNYSVSYNASEALKYTQGVIKIVNHYQQNHNVKIVGVSNTIQHDTHMITFITIKDFNQRFVLNNIAFSFHPGFFRRIVFRYRETKEYLDVYGYGRSQSIKDSVKLIKEGHRHNAIYVPDLGSLGGNAPTLEHVKKVWE